MFDQIFPKIFFSVYSTYDKPLVSLKPCIIYTFNGSGRKENPLRDNADVSQRISHPSDEILITANQNNDVSRTHRNTSKWNMKIKVS